MRIDVLYAALLGRSIWARGSAITKEAVDELPAGWALDGPVDGADSLSLSIALRQPGITALKIRLAEISSPVHPKYGHHLTRDEVQAYLSPQREDVDLVSSWLASHGIVSRAVEHDRIHFSATVSQARSLLDADLAYYSYNGRPPVVRSQSYRLPGRISDAVDFISPIANFMPPKTAKLRPRLVETPSQRAASVNEGDANATNPCAQTVNPTCIRQLYNVNYTAPDGPSPARLGIAGFLNQFANFDDLASFLAANAPSVPPGYNFSEKFIANGTNPQRLGSAGIEASLDIEYGMALGYPAAVTFYSTGGTGVKLGPTGTPLARSDNEPYQDFLSYLLNETDDDLPHVISISYADDEQSVPITYALRVCDMFAALASRGVTVLAGSGDGGATGTGQNQCRSNDGKNTEEMLPTFPASCPYVTGVGATDSTEMPEVGATYSSGGFSNFFTRPDFQADLPTTYATQLPAMLVGKYNASGRATPDIAAVGSGFNITWAGGPSGVFGTSAATPVVAAVVALVNDARLRAGKNATGWINPVLYSTAMRGVLFDVVSGTSTACTWTNGTRNGWPAAEGFDCMTGLGTIGDFEKFLGIFMGLQ